MHRSHPFLRSIVKDSLQSPFKIAQSSKIQLPCVILMSPFLDANVGSVSRTMLNFGLHDLRIVNPRCDILSEAARTLAVGSVELLENAKIYNTLQESIADLNKVIVTTRRDRYINQSVCSPREAMTQVVTLENEMKTGQHKLIFHSTEHHLYMYFQVFSLVGSPLVLLQRRCPMATSACASPLSNSTAV